MSKQLIEIDARHLKKGDKVFCPENRKPKTVNDINIWSSGSVGVKYENELGYWSADKVLIEVEI